MLRRIGNRELPAPGFPWKDAPLIVADSIHLPVTLTPDPKMITLSRAQVIQQRSGQIHHVAARFHASLSWNILTIDNCPIESACFASLVYAPTTLLVAADSLYEVVAPEHLLGPRVYGRVSR